MIAPEIKDIPLLNNQAFMDKFARTESFVSSFNPNRFAIARLEESKTRLKVALPLPNVRSCNHDFVVVTGGVMQRSRHLKPCDIFVGQIFFLPAYQISSAISMSDDVSGFYVNFCDALLREVSGRQDPLQAFPFWSKDSPALWNLEGKVFDSILEILEKLEQFSKSSHPDRESLAAHHLLALFYELKPHLELPQKTGSQKTGSQKTVPQNRNAASSLAERFVERLNAEVGFKNSLSAYAQHLNVSPNYLNKCVKMSFGKTALDLLQEHKLLEAKVLLKHSSTSIGLIAQQLGFNDLTNFGRFFKQKTGFLPSKYRKMIEKAE
jgi:AraC family transcriptional regulator, transcriptional activator of pobA